MRVVVFEDAGHRDLQPLTFARPTFALRCGCDTLLEKVQALLDLGELSVIVRPALAEITPEWIVPWSPDAPADLFLNGRLLTRALPDMPRPSACWDGETLVAARLDASTAARLTPDVFLDAAKLKAVLAAVPTVPMQNAWGLLIRYPWDLIAANPAELRRQIDAMTPQHAGEFVHGVAADADWIHDSPLSKTMGTAVLINPAAIRIGKGTRIKPTAVLDAEDGPIHIGENVTISPHVCVRGPCSIGDGSIIQPGASIREGASIGPICKVGGEVEGSIFQGYGNKQHDGFLGHSYVGEWVNLGADTVTSDLKNTYGMISVPLHGTPIDTGLRFVGSIIGDHSKTAICTRLTTGTVIGFSCNVAAGRPPRHVPSFTWLTDEGSVAYDVDKAIAVARTVMARRKVEITPAMEAVFRRVARERRS